MRSEERAALDDEVLAHCASGARPEDERLRRGTGRIEFLHTQELVRRYVDSESQSHVLDVGGASGVHAEWIAADGHLVHVNDAGESLKMVAARFGARQGAG